MLISSPVFEHMNQIPDKYTCRGQDINPPLEIKGVPIEAESLVLIIDDPDAPNGTWLHWIVWNIDPSITSIPENSIPKDGIQGQNDSGRQMYSGPCPPSGTHHYHFKIYALDSTINLPSTASKEQVLQAIGEHIIDESELIGLYAK